VPAKRNGPRRLAAGDGVATRDGQESWTAMLGHRLRDARVRRGLTLRDAAGQVGVTGSFLSQVEHGRTHPSLVTLRRLAQTLGVTLGSFLGDEPVTERVVTPERRQRLAWPKSKVTFEFVATPGRKYVQLAIIKFEVGGQTAEEPVAHNYGEECSLVTEGAVRVVLGDGNQYLLRKGDAITLDRTMPHLYRNEARSRSTLICAIYPATF
jgi:transcriptional regulator with XRE-family HTH domain